MLEFSARHSGGMTMNTLEAGVGVAVIFGNRFIIAYDAFYSRNH